MNGIILIVLLAAVLALAFAAFNYTSVKALEEGTPLMAEIAGAIRVGASAFIRYEYRVLYTVVAAVAVILALVTSWQSAIAFLIGSVMSGCAGFIGMKIATYANVRVSNEARKPTTSGKP